MDTLHRADITIFGGNSINQVNASKPRSKTLYCALVNGYYGSRFHSKHKAKRAVRLLKSWGLDAYISGPVKR